MPLIKPKILTKFPNTKITFNSIPDKVIIDHCFPTGKIEITNNTDDISITPPILNNGSVPVRMYNER